MAELSPQSYGEQEMFAAFLAGFDASGEGYNGEYVYGCHNVPDDTTTPAKSRPSCWRSSGRGWRCTMAELPRQSDAEPVISGRGLAYWPRIATENGAAIDVYESSAARSGIYLRENPDAVPFPAVRDD